MVNKTKSRQDEIADAFEKFQTALAQVKKDHFALGDGGRRGTQEERSAIKSIQKALGMPEKLQTGYLGKLTQQKLSEFQTASLSDEDTANDLKIDGKAGINSARQLLKASSSLAAEKSIPVDASGTILHNDKHSSLKNIAKAPALPLDKKLDKLSSLEINNIQALPEPDAGGNKETLFPQSENPAKPLTPKQMISPSVLDAKVDLDAGHKMIAKLKVEDPCKALVMRLEGFAPKKYKDSVNNPTIGYGISLGSGTMYRNTVSELLDEKKELTPDKGYEMLNATMENKMNFAKAKFGPGIDKLRDNERDGLMSTVYSLKEKSVGKHLVSNVTALAKFDGSEPEREKLVNELANTVEKYGKNRRRKVEGMIIRGDYAGADKEMDNWKGEKAVPLLNDRGLDSGKKVENVEIKKFQEYYSEGKAPEQNKSIDQDIKNKSVQNSTHPIDLPNQKTAQRFI